MATWPFGRPHTYFWCGSVQLRDPQVHWRTRQRTSLACVCIPHLVIEKFVKITEYWRHPHGAVAVARAAGFGGLERRG